MERTHLYALGVVGTMLCAAAAGASERDGVACPSGADAMVQQGVLKCSVRLEHVRMSICPRLDYPNYTQIEIKELDQCKPQVMPLRGRASVDSGMTPLPQTRLAGSNRPVTDPTVISAYGVLAVVPPPDSAYRRQVDRVSQDRFTALQVVFVWPQGMPLPATVGHDPKNGVSCPPGYDATVLNGRGLRCSDTVVRKAGCDIVNPLNPLSPWTIERRTGRDLCVSKDLTGNRVTGQYTIPTDAGYVGAMGNPSQNGWRLDTDRSGNVDYWIKDGTSYEYPVAR